MQGVQHSIECPFCLFCTGVKCHAQCTTHALHSHAPSKYVLAPCCAVSPFVSALGGLIRLRNQNQDMATSQPGCTKRDNKAPTMDGKDAHPKKRKQEMKTHGTREGWALPDVGGLQVSFLLYMIHCPQPLQTTSHKQLISDVVSSVSRCLQVSFFHMICCPQGIAHHFTQAVI